MDLSKYPSHCPEHGEVLHAGCQEFRLVVYDPCIMECVKELMNMIVRKVRSEDRLDQCGVGRNTVFLTEADSAESILNRCGKRFQDVVEFPSA